MVLYSSPTLATGGSSGDNISFSSTIKGDADGTRSLTLNAGAGGAISLSGAVGGSSKDLSNRTLTNSSTATFSGTVNTDGNFTNTAGATTLGGTTTVGGNFAINGGSVTAPASMTVAGNWTNNAGAGGFVHGSGTVTLNSYDNKNSRHSDLLDINMRRK